VFDDFESTGGAICNKCLPECGDGFELLVWWTGKKFHEVVDEVAVWLGMDPARKAKKGERKEKEDKNPHEKVQLYEWRPGYIPFFCKENKGITERGLLLSGICFGKHRHNVCLLFKVFSAEDLTTLNGYVAMSAMSSHLKLWNGECVVPERKVSVGGTKSGLIGEEAIKLLAAGGIVETVWKTEGPTDLAALCSIIPPDQWGKHVAITSSAGAKNVPDGASQFLARAKNVFVVADRDKDGIDGANLWAGDIVACGGNAKVIHLPEGDWKDVRKFISENGDLAWGKLLSLAESVTEKASPTKPLDIPRKYQDCLDTIGLDVLCQDPTSVLVYSTVTGRTGQIRGPIARFQQEDLVQMVGIPGATMVGKDIEGGYEMKDVRMAIAMAASARYVEDVMAIRGIGVYRGREGDRDCIVVCNGSHLSVMDADGNWKRIDKPRYGGLLFRFGGKTWYDHDEIGRLIARAKVDKEWVCRKWDEVTSYFNRWTWRYQDNDPKILAALVGATWIQDLWKYRPQVSLRGESDAGKSSFCDLLFGNATSGEKGIFGDLAVRIASSTAAGIRQTIGHTSYVVCMDEFDSNSAKERMNVVKLLRTAGPGDTITMGTSHHHAIRFGMRATVWVSGVSVSLDEQMDKNRFLPFDILYPKDAKFVAWVYPTRAEIRDASISTLAIAIAYGLEASRIASGLRRKVNGKKVNKRIVEGLAGAATLVALSATDNEDNAMTVLDSFVEAISERTIDEGQEKTHEEVLSEIEAMTINIGHQMQMTVAAILADDADYCDSREEVITQLETQLSIGKKTKDGKTYLVVHPGTVAKRLGRGKAEVSQLLRRTCEGTLVQVTKLAKAPFRAVWIPWEYVRDRNASEIVDEQEESKVF
jgi:hypothetical protein